jgi:hypothetical protein
VYEWMREIFIHGRLNRWMHKIKRQDLQAPLDAQYEVTKMRFFSIPWMSFHSYSLTLLIADTSKAHSWKNWFWDSGTHSRTSYRFFSFFCCFYFKSTNECQTKIEKKYKHKTCTFVQCVGGIRNNDDRKFFFFYWNN